MDDQGNRIRRTKAATAVKGAKLQFRELELATLADAVPQGPDWVHEVKFDGYRTLTIIDAEKVTMFSRSGLDWTNKYADIARRLKDLKVDNAIRGRMMLFTSPLRKRAIIRPRYLHIYNIP